MGGTLSVCGLGDRDAQLHYQSKDFARDLERPAQARGRSLSTATDSSVASILSNSEQLIPDAFLPKDIQVLSQRRQRLGHHHSRSSWGSSKVGSASSRGAGTVRVVRNSSKAVDVADCSPGVSASLRKKTLFGIKTASSSFGYSDDEGNPAAAGNSRLPAQELRVK
ncbi:hypothetical protein PHYSODRAFT_355077 [Phytophthora sojae]|uniref:Uncharacterized protein n=1 Tax=Phytophthora sojae (strain P6497) TaxID=1094619 RepID=G4ZVG0_PHYSP|nr:hypothetical protein PHYSODRAFT_355077 [Phytophthora sojae]EGZ11478.1 hypothetical protein PHYSODRAFT_355077 [Phytophthora sojae]|eukprot:XP_009531811.1 hypothetical protein PHYSODRAFT_355077 [Phytophthora sojae]